MDPLPDGTFHINGHGIRDGRASLIVEGLATCTGKAYWVETVTERNGKWKRNMSSLQILNMGSFGDNNSNTTLKGRLRDDPTKSQEPTEPSNSHCFPMKNHQIASLS
eukprot:scaffold415564_cov93-Attheya_sp.AAC.1